MPAPLASSHCPPAAGKTVPLLEQFRQTALKCGHSEKTTEVLAERVRAFILFHGKQHPAEMGLPQATAFLEHVVKTSKDPLPTLAMSRAALSLLYAKLLQRELGELPQPRPPRLLDQLRLVLRVRHYSRRTEECYVNWA